LSWQEITPGGHRSKTTPEKRHQPAIPRHLMIDIVVRVAGIREPADRA